MSAKSGKTLADAIEIDLDSEPETSSSRDATPSTGAAAAAAGAASFDGVQEVTMDDAFSASDVAAAKKGVKLKVCRKAAIHHGHDGSQAQAAPAAPAARGVGPSRTRVVPEEEEAGAPSWDLPATG